MDAQTSPYRDASGRALTDYPRPSVAVDTAVLTISPAYELSVVLIRRHNGHQQGQWQLPGTFLHPGETLAQAALRALSTKAGIHGLAPQQLAVFDDPARDDRGWVLSVAHLDVVPWGLLAANTDGQAQATPVEHAAGLAFDHDRIVDLAGARLRDEYAHAPDPRHLLEEPFTLLQLQRLHEAIAGHPLPKDSFRRAMQPQLQPTGELAHGVVGKPARLFTRTSG